MDIHFDDSFKLSLNVTELDYHLPSCEIQCSAESFGQSHIIKYAGTFWFELDDLVKFSRNMQKRETECSLVSMSPDEFRLSITFQERTVSFSLIINRRYPIPVVRFGYIEEVDYEFVQVFSACFKKLVNEVEQTINDNPGRLY